NGSQGKVSMSKYDRIQPVMEGVSQPSSILITDLVSQRIPGSGEDRYDHLQPLLEEYLTHKIGPQLPGTTIFKSEKDYADQWAKINSSKSDGEARDAARKALPELLIDSK